MIVPARSSCRACEAAFGCEAVVESGSTFFQAVRVPGIYEDFVLERSLAGSTAATGVGAESCVDTYARRRQPL